MSPEEHFNAITTSVLWKIQDSFYGENQNNYFSPNMLNCFIGEFDYVFV